MNPEVLNADCMVEMKKFPDKFFDLAICDPPYGIGVNHSMGRRKGDRPSGHKPAVWDSAPPKMDYFGELFRVSKNQIIWGANHFISKMPLDSPCWLMWDKGFSFELSFAQFELAWTSFETTCKKCDIHTNGDTHLGSGSSRIAAHDMGFDFWGYEIDKDYFEAQEKRFKQHIAQLTLSL